MTYVVGVAGHDTQDTYYAAQKLVENYTKDDILTGNVPSRRCWTRPTHPEISIYGVAWPSKIKKGVTISRPIVTVKNTGDVRCKAYVRMRVLDPDYHLITDTDWVYLGYLDVGDTEAHTFEFSLPLDYSYKSVLIYVYSSHDGSSSDDSANRRVWLRILVQYYSSDDADAATLLSNHYGADKIQSSSISSTFYRYGCVIVVGGYNSNPVFATLWDNGCIYHHQPASNEGCVYKGCNYDNNTWFCAVAGYNTSLTYLAAQKMTENYSYTDVLTGNLPTYKCWTG